MRLRLEVFGLPLLHVATGQDAYRTDDGHEPGDVGSFVERLPEGLEPAPDVDDRIGFRPRHEGDA